MKTRKYTPEIIEKLKKNEIFVFGSNTEGRHGGGAALKAFRKFGAAYGQASGLSGHSYAIITLRFRGPRYPLTDIFDEVIKFSIFAEEHPELKFYVTKIGSGIAGYEVSEIAMIFAKVHKVQPFGDNVILPIEYECR